MVIVEWSLPILVKAHKLFVIFSIPCLFRQEVVKQLWWVAGVHLETTHHINVALAVWLTLLTARIHWTDTFILSTEAPRNLPGRLLFFLYRCMHLFCLHFSLLSFMETHLFCSSTAQPSSCHTAHSGMTGTAW